MAMKYVLDTSAYSGFNRGDQRLKKYFVADAEILIPQIVIGELRAGFALGSRQAQNEKLLIKFLNAPNVRTVSLSNKTTQLYASTYLKLRQSGKPIGSNDMWIAALALEHAAQLLTLDSDFSFVADLKLLLKLND